MRAHGPRLIHGRRADDKTVSQRSWVRSLSGADAKDRQGAGQETGQAEAAEAVHGAAAVDVAGPDGVVGVRARRLPGGQCLLCVVRQAVRDQLQGVAGHHALQRLGVPILQVARAHDEAFRRVACVDEVHRRRVLVPARDVAILHARAEAALPTILAAVDRNVVMDHIRDGLGHAIEGLNGVLRVVRPAREPRGGGGGGEDGRDQAQLLGHR
mmetsp:Transcript_109590/g.353627  ORF Transcript_109590/g.353627 Transcript_109590/m.353627 type:complete len:212 (-) Transcript_109590:73-708(-)